ncbi:piezo-type mechanosensitive ion channel component-like isoform X4 [Sitodiplosis mosellana]|uniref:piezo-type mechanosensitive ion channel component-like isoform X4 n=1 Tax=Sitodiplosis mosellana TaxID=263140 RepID=UPI0024444B85|nr:piezo-type mechanosensitive ion channel component-like isoform X4 [Sitodiplosis mosellana]
MSAVILYIVQRVIFPILFTFCIVSRPTILSIPYLLFLFYAPYLPFSTKKPAHSHTRWFFKCVIGKSAIIVLVQIGLQLTLYAKDQNSLRSLVFFGQHLHNIGVTELYNADTQSFCWSFLIDVFLCMAGVIALIVYNKISTMRRSSSIEDSLIINNIFGRNKYLKSKSYAILKGIGIFFVMSTLLFSSILQPSIPSSLYFVAFVLLTTFWAMNKSVYHSFVIICRILCIVLIVHLSTIFAFQSAWIEKHINRNSIAFRYFGLKSLIRPVQNNFVPVIVLNEVDALLSPIALLLCYYSSVIFLQDIHKKKEKLSCLYRLADNPPKSIEEEPELSRIPNLTKSFISRVYGFMCRHNNIGSNLMMMLWSIVFRSYLSIVFLFVVSVLWTLPIARKSVLLINLFVVFYADLLLVCQYFYCIILTADELPFSDQATFSMLAQIGVVRYEIFPCVPLLFKAICTITFCFTLRREHVASRDAEQKRASARYSFQISSEKKDTIWKCFDFGVNGLSQIWVLMILVTMFIYAIYGYEVNFMKLSYMIYVLVFVISYQLSLCAWRRMTYALWMLVIISSMVNLMLIYTYQFEKFELWENYLGINKHMQNIIGLRRYETKDLLIQLIYFTFLVVITAIQLLIFHDKYTQQFVWKKTDSCNNVRKQRAADGQNGAENAEPSDKSYLEKMMILIKLQVILGISSVVDMNTKAMGWMCRFLELQLFKVILILGFIMSISEISSFNLLLNVLVILACLCENYTTRLSCGIISLVAGVIVILKMLYQLFKVPQEFLDLFCFTDANTNIPIVSLTMCDTNNTAQWIGIQKLNNEENLLQFLGPYLIFLAASTVFTSILYHQKRKRFQRGDPSKKPKVLFENVTREDADKSVSLLIKYLFNYGFYKFGIESTLIMLVSLISFRKDTMSIVYIIWLCAICGVRRRTKQFIWPIFQYFVTIATIVQYGIMLNLPSFLYSNFQWEFHLIQRLEAFVSIKNHPSKLLCDFLLLMCICRQQNVFRIERKNGSRKYPGGSNESSVDDVGNIIAGQLPIKTHDFLYPTNWLDILKCVLYFSSFWVTLSVVLLTGTNNISVFSLGYLVSSFLFCYIGTNFYMKPIRTILRWWNTLIVFNVFVIIVKSVINLRLIIDGTFLSHQMVASVHEFLNEEKQSIKPLDSSYDCLCFAFLIFQLRIFKSFDFCHIINESKATFVCDSRGTKLLADRMHEMHSTQMERERETLEKIKQKVERIKVNQQKFEPNLIPAKTHHEAVRYNGKYLYEELVEKSEFNPRQNESSVESEESFLLRNHSRFECTMKDSNTSNRNGSRFIANESKAENDDRVSQNNYVISILRDLLISITLYLYKFSRNYRFVHEILTKEKKLLKLKACGSETNFCSDQEGMSEERTYFFSHQHSIVSEFCQALWFALIANTDVICYLFIFLNTILSMSILTLPMSLCVCLWATLTIPRPSKRFWLTVIAYTEFQVFVQYFLQIMSHFHKIEFARASATYNLILLHIVLFHRSVLKHMGIWTLTKKVNENAVHALDFLNVRSLNSTIRCNSIVQMPADVYTFMFLCDLFNFFVLMFGFSAFSQSPYDAGVQNYLEEDQIPFRFLLTLLVQFVLLIIDRALYLRRNMKGKIVFYVISVIAVHIWQCHFMLVYCEKRSHSITWPPMLFYYVKCVYFLLSAYQIRCGYPKRVSGNFANNGFSLMHCYQMIPFLSEARTLLDWICIKTSLTLYEWFKMEDIYSDLFTIKCHRQYEKTVPRPRGVVRGTKGDYMRAAASLIIFFCLIWGPWALFTFDHTVGKSNIPYEVSVSLHVGSAEPLYRMTAQTRNINQFSESDFDALKGIYANNTAVQSIISKYDEDDIAAISLDVNSSSLWLMSPPSLQKLKRYLRENVTMKFRYSISISRLSHEKSDVVEDNHVFVMHENDAARQELIRIIQEGDHNQRVHLPFLFPKFLKVMNAKGLQPIPQLQANRNYQNVTLRLNEDNAMQWWELAEDCNETYYQEVLSKLPYADCSDNTVMYTFNDKLYPSSLSPYIAGGIIGLYSTYLLFSSKFFRQCLASKVTDIIQKDLPYVDRILQLCSDIYLVREQGDFKLEEDLYGKLIFLYRSPETMIRWTRLPEQETTVDDTSDIDESDAEKALRKSLHHRII